jgi:hypothetical protein
MNPESTPCLTPREIQELLYATLASPDDEFPSHPHLASCARCQEEFRALRQSAEQQEDLDRKRMPPTGTLPPPPGYEQRDT